MVARAMNGPGDHDRMHSFLQKQANLRGRLSNNCLKCGKRMRPYSEYKRKGTE